MLRRMLWRNNTGVECDTIDDFYMVAAYMLYVVYIDGHQNSPLGLQWTLSECECADFLASRISSAMSLCDSARSLLI